MPSLPEDVLRLVYLCAFCGDCREPDKRATSNRPFNLVCPAREYHGFEAFDARGRMQIIRDLVEGRIRPDRSLLEWAMTCVTCGGCREVCLNNGGEGIDTPLIMEYVRNMLISMGLKTEKQEIIVKSTLENRNPYREPYSERFRIIDNMGDEDSDTALFLGCTSLYRRHEIAKATIETLRLQGLKFRILKEETCCGSVLKRMGFLEEFRKLAEHNIKLWKKEGVRRIVTPCAGCYRTIGKDYRELGLDIEVLHLVQLVDPEKIPGKLEGPVVYHDPCHLGRHMEVYEEPRRILKKIYGEGLLEFERNRAQSWCCGAGGGVKANMPGQALHSALLRLKEAQEIGAEMLVSACPFCLHNFKDAAEKYGVNIILKDISEVIVESYKAKPKVKPPAKLEVPVRVERPTSLMDYLRVHPEIFRELREECKLQYRIDGEEFVVERTRDGIEVRQGAEASDIELIISREAARKLMEAKTKQEYMKLFAEYYLHPTDDLSIDIELKKPTKKLMSLGYGEWAKKAGIM